MEKILVLSDDADWRESTVGAVEAAGHQAHAMPLRAVQDDPSRIASGGAIVLDLRRQASPAARITQVRRAAGRLRIYVLAVFTAAQAARLDLAAGFDDFVVEPFPGEEVAARVRQLRWRENRTESADILKARDLVVNRASCEVTLRGVALSLTYQEYELLRYLVEHRGRVFTREQLLSELWGYDYYGGTRTVDVHVRRLRAKLGPEYEDLIQTVRNVGYRFAREP